MKVLVTGAKGFVGKNLCLALNNIKNGNDKTREIVIDEVFEYDIDSSEEDLEFFCKNADFVLNLAGVNRPKDNREFMEGNFGFASELLDTLKKYKNKCPVMISSSIQATLEGRFSGSEYGLSKKAGEDLFFDYEKQTGAKVLVYRFPNLFGKWCKPNYNSAVATFCYNIANGLPITVNDRNVQLELLYIDDLIDELIDALSGKEKKCRYNGVDAIKDKDGRFCYSPITHKVTLGEIVDLLYQFKDQPKTLVVPEIKAGSFASKLYSTFLSYLNEKDIVFDLKMNCDDRGSFTELIRTVSGGQFSINVSKPSVTKGGHFHNSKWEFFIVIKGEALIKERKIGSEEVIEFRVSDKKLQAVHILPGYTHSIENLSETEDLVTFMWANENFNPDKPDTFKEKV